MYALHRSSLAIPFSVLAVLGSAAPAADGICDPAESLAGLCFVSPGGFVVEAVTGPGGEFPVIDAGGNSVFSYLITGPGATGGSCSGVKDISHASLLFPSTCSAADLDILEAHPAAEILAQGHGDPSCGFGTGNLKRDVLKWDEEVGCGSSLLVTVVIRGHVPAAPTTFSLKAGPQCSTDTILGPACPDVTRYCEATPNSAGDGTQIGYLGSLSIADNSFHLTASGLPPNQVGFFFFGTQEGHYPLGNGYACIAGRITRMDKSPFAPNGTTVLHVDFTVPPADAILPGIPYYFQMFYRDTLGGGAGFNTSDALIVTFDP